MTEELPLDATAADATEALDDVQIEEVPPAQVPPVTAKPRPSSPGTPPRDSRPVIDAPSSQPGSRARSDTSPPSKRGRARMAIRIPDDEISRPQSASPPATEPTPTVPHAMHAPPRRTDGPADLRNGDSDAPSDAPTPSPPALQPMRIISIGVPADPTTDPPARVAPPPPAAPKPPSKEDSWTPFQPTTADALPTVPRLDAAYGRSPSQGRSPAPSEDLIPIESDILPEGPDSAEPLDLDEAESQSVLSSRPPPASPVAAAPAVAVPPAAKAPAVAAFARAPSAPGIPPPRSLAPTEPEGEEVSFDDDEPMVKAQHVPRAPGSGDRVSEPGDAPEIAPEDLVSVESVPSGSGTASAKAGSPGSMGGPTPAKAFVPPGFKAPPAPAATALPPMRAKSPSMPSSPPPAAGGAKIGPLPAVDARQPSKTTTQQIPKPTPATGGRPPLVIVPPHIGVAPPQSEAPGAKRKVRPWWEELFNDDFIRTMAKISDAQIAKESDFIEDSLGVAKGGTVLDLACGTGRHAIELARRGYEVVGFDLSLAMLARAADEAQERDQKLNFVQGDMREMSFDEAFDGVYCWNTSFGFFDEETNAKVVERIHKSLKKGGQFVLDVANRDFTVKQAPSLCWFEGDGCVCMDEMSIDWITSRMKIKRTMMMDDGRSKEIEYTIRLYSLHELGLLLHESGFRVAEVSGRTGTPGVFFGGESPRTLVLAEKR